MAAMEKAASYSFQRLRRAPEDEYPLAEVSLGLLVHVKAHAPMPESALARLALRELRRLVGEAEVRHLKLAAKGERSEPEKTPAAAQQEPSVSPADLAGLDKRIVNTAYRILDFVAQRGGKALATELVEEVSAPTLARFLDPATPAGQAVAPWFLVEKHGRTRSITLTAEGRRIAQARKPET